MMKTYNKYFILLIICFYNTFNAQVLITNNLTSNIAPNTDLKLEIKINKGAIANFSKFQIDVPNGVTVKEGDSKTGNFTFENNRAKIVWVSIPTDSEFIISMTINTGALNGSQQFFQKFFYLDNGVKKEVEVEAQTVNFVPEGSKELASLSGSSNANSNNNSTTVANNNTTSTSGTSNTSTNPTNNTTETPTVATNTSTETTNNSTTSTNNTTANTNNTTTETVAKTTDNSVNNPTNTNTNSTVSNSNTGNYNYRIQLGAFTASPQKSKFNAAGKVQIVNENGFFKVLCGNFSSKDEANKKLNSLKSSGLDGFVVTYQNGTRVK